MKKTNKKQEESEEIVPVEEVKEISPVADHVGENETRKTRTSHQNFGDIMRNIVLAFLRLVIVVIVIGGCASAIYFGGPLVYENYIRPVEQNTTEMKDIRFRQSQSEIQVTELQSRVATLEAAQAVDDSSITDLNTRVETLENTNAQLDQSFTELTYKSDLNRVAELLSRARLFMYQSNFGLARSDVQAARDILAQMQPSAPEDKQKDLIEALFRLDLALKNLPEFPVAASDDLDIAWQVLMDGYPVSPTATPTPLPTMTAIEPTVTPFPLTETATPIATP